MENEIISYIEMCQREGTSLQKGMNFNLGGNHSIILMSLRKNAPYRDRVEDDGSTIIYESHDVPKNKNQNPKLVDQPEVNASGTLTENGKFQKAAQEFKRGLMPPERIRVYEKIKTGIWSYNGIFHLVDFWKERDEHREVFKFKLLAVEGEENLSEPIPKEIVRRRIIPTWIKLEVWKRDGGKCIKCGATDELHFDHVLPYSKGGTSIKPENVQLLCARHNLQKSDKII